ncbi:MAG: hypothetical protein GY874_10070 [Desulfobacteraceae bacterium]|nr:hypothetical protein [Desulfobacteraceae bacterium]
MFRPRFKSGLKTRYITLLLFFTVCLLCNWHCPQASNITSRTQTGLDSTREPDLESLASEFKRLRRIQGHFGGGSWNDLVDRWNGRKHQVMRMAARKFVKERPFANELLTLMGSADFVANQGDSQFEKLQGIHGEIKAVAKPDRYLIYFWRGWHDYLYFACQGKKILRHGWWYAGE